MGIFSLGARKPQAAPPKQTTPTDEVLRMRQQGFTNNQVVQALQRNGYQTSQIFDAMNQADLKSGAPIPGVMPDEVPDFTGMPAKEAPAQEPAQAEQQQYPEQQPTGYEQQIEEVAEAIIEEKWEDLLKTINKTLEWKDATETRMTELEQSFRDLKENYDKLQQGILGKVSEYDKNMREAGTSVKAMENVLQKILPTLTDSVNSLSRMTKKTTTKKNQ